MIQKFGHVNKWWLMFCYIMLCLYYDLFCKRFTISTFFFFVHLGICYGCRALMVFIIRIYLKSVDFCLEELHVLKWRLHDIMTQYFILLVFIKGIILKVNMYKICNRVLTIFKGYWKVFKVLIFEICFISNYWFNFEIFTCIYYLKSKLIQHACCKVEDSI